MTDTPDPFVLVADALPSDAKVLTVSGTEGVSRLYTFEVMLLVPSSAADDFDALGALFTQATLQFQNADGTPRATRHGVVAAVELVHEHADKAIYRVVIAPELWKMTLRKHVRVFTKGHDPSTIPDILEWMLREAGITGDKLVASYENRGRYAKREHVCQWDESDFDFIARWMEREGICFWFDHPLDGTHEVLHLADTKSAHAPSAGVPARYIPTAASDGGQPEAMETWRSRVQGLPASIKLFEYDPLNPDPTLRVEHAITSHGFRDTRSLFDNYIDPGGEGARLGTVRAQEIGAREQVFHGRGRLFDLKPGFLFKLDEHPRASMNTDYLCLEIEHQGNNLAAHPEAAPALGVSTDRTYQVHVTALPGDTQYRPPRRTPVPRISGVEIGQVDGPLDDDYAQLDEHGRYRVFVRYDARGPDHPAGDVSMWVRMLQPHAGNPEGFHFPLRKNTEVMLVFLGGDPDRPVIAGAVPNADTPSPVTSANHTQNVIHTGGDNELRIEDTKDAQWIDLSSPPEKSFLHLGKHHDAHAHNFILSTDGNGLIHTGGQEDVTVGGDLVEKVTGDVKETYGADRITKITGNDTRTVGGDAKNTIAGDEKHTIGGDQGKMNGGYQQTLVGGDQTNIAGGDQMNIVGGDRMHMVGGSEMAMVTSSQTTLVGTSQTITVGASLTITAPAVTINAATFTLNVPTTAKQGASENWFTPNAFQVTGLKNDHSIVVNEIDAIKIEHCGFHVTQVAIEISNCGYKQENDPAKMEQLGVDLKNAATSIKSAAANLVTAAITLFS